MPAHHKRSETGVAANPHAGPVVGDASYRNYFVTAEQYQAAMALAARLEAKGMPRRAWRVRLNIDGQQSVFAPLATANADDDEDDSEAQRLIKQARMSHQKIGDAIGVAKQTVTKWGAGGQIGPDKLKCLRAFVNGLKSFAKGLK